MKTWLFWDHWHFDQLQGAELRQGKAKWVPEGSYVDPLFKGLATWPTVYRDEESGRWRMLYSADFLPKTVLIAESDDGIRWKPLNCPEIQFQGEKLAPHHLFTLESGSGGGVYLDPVAEDGFPFKIFGIQHGSPTVERVLRNPNHHFYEVAKAGGQKRCVVEELTMVSKDGLSWSVDYQADWGKPHWDPEPPVYAFYNAHTEKHTMTARPGHGDRRVVAQTSEDARNLPR